MINQFNTPHKNTRGSALLKLCLACCITFIFIAPGCKKNEVAPGAGTEGSAQRADGLITHTAAGDEFTIAVIPDPQYYTGWMDTIGITKHGNLEMWTRQIDWIVNNKTAENIKYVVGLGDIADGGDDATNYHQLAQEWVNASYIYHLETAGIPYGVAVGNHEELVYNTSTHQSIMVPANPKTHFNQYFSYSHFSPFKYTGGPTGTPDATHYYGGAVDNSGANDVSHNDNHYDLFTAGGVKFIVIYIEYDNSSGLTLGDGVYNWANNLMTTYASYKAIVVTHNAGTSATPSAFGLQSTKIYTMMKAHANFFMMLGGHVDGEGSREDIDSLTGNKVKTFISDYQFYKDNNNANDGGAGYLRLMKISVANDVINVRTISPYITAHPTYPSAVELTDADSRFIRTLFHDNRNVRTIDMDNDGKSQLGLWDSATGDWNIYGIATAKNYGVSGDQPIGGEDYNGDGLSDYAIFRPSAGQFWLSGTGAITWGQSGDIAVPGDFDGDGRGDFVVYRPSNTTWYIKNSATLANSTVVYGAAGYIPTPGDYDGDGTTDPSFWQPVSPFHWYVHNQNGYDYGQTGDIPAPGDYNGDGKTDIAVYRPSTGKWWLHNQNGVNEITPHATGDIPAPGDYDGLGRTQPAIYRPSTHTLYIGHWGSFTSTSITSVTSITYNKPGKIINLPYCIRQAYGF